MSKKNKGRARANEKRRQGKAAKAIARKRLNKQAKAAMGKLRDMARRGGANVETVEAPKSTSYSLEDELECAECSGVGHCCIDTMVPLDPADVWRMMGNAELRKTFGIELTTDLTKPPEERGIIYYWVDPRTGAPRASMRFDTGEDGKKRCAMLKTTTTGEGEESYSCILGDDRPTVCKANPVGRIAENNEKGRLVGWKYVLQDAPCQACPSNCGSKTVKVEDWMKSKDMEARYAIKDMFHGFVGWLVREIKTEELRKMATMLVFDYDRFPMEAGGFSKEEVIENRPESPENLLVGARIIIDGIMQGMTVPTEEELSNEAQREHSPE